MPLLTLKIDVDTYRGTREGVPNLVRLLQKHQVNATFLFSLGPDHTGWALRRAFRPGFFKKVARTSVVEHYGFKTLMYGTLLPGPDIGKNCADEMRQVKKAGFECGIHTWDHTAWQDHVRRRDANWTQKNMQRAYQRYQEIFDQTAPTHGAAGWQMNPYALMQLDEFGIAYSSDGRAMLDEQGALLHPEAGPYRIKMQDKTLSCIQLPTTLPTMDELLGCHIDGKLVDESNIVNTLLKLSNPNPICDATSNVRHHVYTLHAELEGQKLAPLFEQLLIGWKAQSYDLVSMAEYYHTIKDRALPVHNMSWGTLPGRSGELMVQN